MLEIIAGDIIVKVPNTPEGIAVFKATLKLLEVVFADEENHTETQLIGKEKKQRKENPQEIFKPSPFSPPILSPKQRIKFKNWEAIATTKSGTLYKEVIDRFLTEYKDGIEPSIEILSQIIQEMYGTELKNTSVATYVSVYKRYIRENKLAEKTITNTPSENKGGYKEGVMSLREIPIEQVVEIWNLLPDEFTYKQVKALIPCGTMQSGARIDATNYVIREFKKNPAFECEETSPGVFLKKEGCKKEQNL